MLRSGDQIGPYALSSKLGRGTFGTVWLSERRTLIVTTTAALRIPLDDDINLETVKQAASLWVRASGYPNVLPIFPIPMVLRAWMSLRRLRRLDSTTLTLYGEAATPIR